MAIILQNQTLELQLVELSKQLKVKADDLLERFLKESLLKESKKNSLKYTKLDPKLYMKKLDDEVDEENLTNPFSDVQDSVKYAKELREKSWR